MDYGLYLSTAGALVQNVRVDQIANNLANVQTPGFRRVLQSIEERRPESREDPAEWTWGSDIQDGIGGGVFLHKTLYDQSPGPILATASPLDLAIQGDGYFAVQDPETDEVYYTRAGNFQIDSDRLLRTADGKYLVLDTGGGPIEVEDSATEAFATRVQVRVFPENAERRPVGGNAYRFEGKGETVPPQGRVLEGALEQSSVSAVQEMAEMIEALRAYEASAQMIRSQSETLSRAANEIARPVR